jgi:hypothetical protein
MAGLDVRADVCQLVILSGSQAAPTHVYCAEFLDLPESWRSEGRISQPAQLGQWLHDYLDANGHAVDALCMGLPDTDVTAHEVTLAVDLSDDDVAFQLAIDWADDDAEVCIDFQKAPRLPDEGTERSGDVFYQVRVAPRAQVEMLQQVAKAAKLNLLGVFGRADALRCTQTVVTLPTMSVTLALQCEVAFGLALCAWNEKAFNFLPYRAHRIASKRRAWVWAAGACMLGGMVSSMALMWLLSFAAQAKISSLGDVATVSRAWDEASQAHAQAQGVHQHMVQQHQWLDARQLLHRQTLQWAQTLSQATPGVWVSQLTQRGAQWSVQGEALTSEEAHVFLAQLKALDIWGKPPEMSQRQVRPSTTRSALPIWQFQVDAELKGGM